MRVTELAVVVLTGWAVCGCEPAQVECGGDMPAPVHGRGYWTVCGYNPFTSPKPPTDRRFDVPDIRSRKVFSDCAFLIEAFAEPNPDGPYWPRITQEFGRTPWMLKAVESGELAGRPFVINVSDRRVPRRAFYETAPLDRAHWYEWKGKHPDFAFFRSTAEIVNDTLTIISKAPTNSVWRKWAKADRDGMVEAVTYHYRHQVESHFGDESACIGFRGVGYSADFIAAANGARALVGETTSTADAKHEWRWNVNPMFLRGASRQFNVPWMWYVALFVNGMRADGTWQNDSWPYSSTGKNGGISPSLLGRVLHFAYLTGASATECEGWNCWGYQPGPDGKFAWTSHGRAFADFHDFTDAHPDRGVPYAPVALLIPYNQGYTALGGGPISPNGVPCDADDLAVNALFFTLMPAEDRAAAIRAGREGCLRNAPFAQMYDVMVPDSPQDPDAFLKALKRHPVAIVAGHYKDHAAVDRVLARYRAAGGTVVAAPKLAYDNTSLDAMNAGRLAFPAYAKMFAELEKKLFPFAVTGDVLYGANKTTSGWWLWAINNNGITKWTDTEAKLDAAAVSELSVDLKDVRVRRVRELMSGREIQMKDGKFAFTVPAAGLAVFELTEK